MDRTEVKIMDKEGNVIVVEKGRIKDFEGKISSVEEVEATESIVNLMDKCNQNCIFCSRGGVWKKDSDEEIEKIILSQKSSIALEGGEPTLNKDLIKWVRLAKRNGTKDIILVTNGVMLFYKDFTKRLIDEGVTLFNINFPTHIEEINDKLTGTRGLFRKKVCGIKNLIDLGAAKKTRLTFVINSLNYKTMPEYVRFVKKEFPGIFYIEFNLIKELGYVCERKYLIPRLKEIEPYLCETMKFCKKNKIHFLVDGIPLCYMNGFEQHSIDAKKLINNRYTFLCEKARGEICKKCLLTKVCAGPREDYLRIYGEKELTPLSGNIDEVMGRIKNEG